MFYFFFGLFKLHVYNQQKPHLLVMITEAVSNIVFNIKNSPNCAEISDVNAKPEYFS